MSSDLVKRLREKINTTCNEAADRIEALEGEVARLRTESAEYLQFWKNNAEACAEAEARAERLRVALVRLATVTTLDPEYKTSDLTLAGFLKEIARKALEDDKPAIRAAAGEEGK